MMFYSFDYWLFMLPAIILTMLASWYVQSAYRRWGRVPASSRISGAEAAQRLAVQPFQRAPSPSGRST